MFTAFICVALIIGTGIVAHWLSSAYEDYREYYETQNKYNDR